MDAATEYLLKNGFGSIGETARAYSNSYKNLNNIRTVNEDEFNNSFLTVINFRIVAYESIGIDGGNLLIPIRLNGLNKIHAFFNEMEVYIKTEIPESEYIDKSIGLRIDLPTMILYSMILESNNKRIGFAGAREQFMRMALKIVHQEVKTVCPYQVLFSEDDFIEENYPKIYAFIHDVDNSLGDLIRMANPRGFNMND